MNGLTGFPITFESLFPIVEGVISTAFSYMPYFIGIVAIMISARLIPFLISKFLGH